jgi:CDGSH-type Zn-finger protein
MSKVKINLAENGPVLVEGSFEIKNSNGEQIPTEEQVALCRCGGSDNKPFCEGTHQKINFKG